MYTNHNYTKLDLFSMNDVYNDVNNDIRRDADQNNKVRTYQKFKTIEQYKCEDYLRQIIKAIPATE